MSAARRLRAWWERVVEQERQPEIGSDDDLMAVADSLDDDPCLDPGLHTKTGCLRCAEFIERCKDEQAKERLRDMVLSRASSLFIARECEAIARVSAAFDPGGWEL